MRVGKPVGITGLINMVDDPKFATGVGLVVYGSRNVVREKLSRAEGNFITRTFRGLKHWVLDFF